MSPCLGTPQYLVSHLSRAIVVINAWQGIVELIVAWQNHKAQGVHHVRHQRRRRRPHGSDQRTLAYVSANGAVGIWRHVGSCGNMNFTVSLICVKCWELRKGSWVKILRPESYWFQTRGQVVSLGSLKQGGHGQVVRFIGGCWWCCGCSFSLILTWTSMLVYVYAGRAERNFTTLIYSICESFTSAEFWNNKPTSQPLQTRNVNQKAEVKYPVTVKFDRVNFSMLQLTLSKSYIHREPLKGGPLGYPGAPKCMNFENHWGSLGFNKALSRSIHSWIVPVWTCMMQSWDINLKIQPWIHQHPPTIL